MRIGSGSNEDKPKFKFDDNPRKTFMESRIKEEKL